MVNWQVQVDSGVNLEGDDGWNWPPLVKKTQAVYNRGGEGNLYISLSSVGLRYRALRMTPLVENCVAQLITQTAVSQCRGQLY